jgi:hypothetical protein
MSARVAFSVSLTCTPPMPRKPPPSEEASATFWLMVCSQALKTGASCGALALRMADTSLKLSSERCTASAGLVTPARCLRNAS